MRTPTLALAAAMLALLFATEGPPAAVAGAGADCRAACDARGIPASCRWLAEKPRRCQKRAVKACKKAVRDGLPVACQPPEDLPACLTNHSCPFGALCVDATCQVVQCGGGDFPPCGPSTTCQGDKCVVSQCSGSTENCPVGFHCQPDEGPLGSVSGTCAADDPGVTYCTNDVGCITPGEFDLVCRRGTCEPRGRNRPRRRTTTTATSSTSTSSTTSTTSPYGGACFDVFDCSGPAACCNGQCVADPYAGMGTCTDLYTPSCTLCETDDDCGCNGIFCDSCGGSASLSGCVNPCL